ncbi:hypothetical protein GCM10009785_26350 [Brooklawnia cerclae]|uniref:ABC-2 transporter permease n=1 Tax=Brooklawnia cerclae TaxID=349934 RepID=A0ABX0SG51_9ACTN|nr:ABC-2 transporter permease [Brooklawnia cerclae]NIH57358.1 hypothetical protein [Brooklawnia cerclae]
MDHAIPNLVGLNIRTLRPMARIVILFVVIAALMIAATRDTSMAWTFVLMLPLVLALRIMPNEGNTAVTRLFGTLPVTRDQTVVAQFITMGLLCLIAVVLPLPLGAIGRSPLPIEVSALMGGALGAALALTLAITAPFAYHGGFGPFAMYAPMMVFAAGAAVVVAVGNVDALPRVLDTVMRHAWPTAALLVIGGVVALTISCLISCRVFARRDL